MMRGHIIFIIFVMVLAQMPRAAAQTPKVVDIWQGVKGHKSVKMTIYPAAGKTAVVVCPGGSYFWHDMKAEGHEVGRWLQRNGISAFVLHYRTAMVPAFVTRFRYIFRGRRYPDAQEDLKRAIKYIKVHSQELGIDTLQIGAMGFSAGGHLVMSGAELFEAADRPAFVAPIYPVVTMSAPCVHKRSRRALLGDSRKNNRRLRDSLSLERHIPDDCPPVFLVNCNDDPVVNYQNSVLLDSALTAKNVKHTYYRYNTGGHGFGASDEKGTPECRQWKEEFLKWLKNIQQHPQN